MSSCRFVVFSNCDMESLGQKWSQNRERCMMELEDVDVGAEYVPWNILDNQLDSMNRTPHTIRFTPTVVFAEDHSVISIEDDAFLRWMESNPYVQLCFKEGEAVWKHYQKEKGKEDKRLHYHAVIVSTKPAINKWLERNKIFAEQRCVKAAVNADEGYTLVKAFRYTCKGGHCIVNRGYPVDRIRHDYWYIKEQIDKYKESNKCEKKRKFACWSDEVYANVSHTATTQTAIAIDIIRYYHKCGKLLPQPFLMGQMCSTFVYRNNLEADHPISDVEMVRRLYPNLA